MAAAGAAVAAVLVFLLLGRMNSGLLARAFMDCESHLAAAPMEMKNLLDEQLRDTTENLYERFNQVLRPVREKLGEHERRQVYQHWQIENLARTFDGLEGELRMGDAPES